MRSGHITNASPGLAGLAGAVVLGLAAGPSPAGSGQTDILELVMYAVNNDTPCELVRYTFDSEEFTLMGALMDASGQVFNDTECLTYIPEGDDKGFYAAHNFNGETKSRIIKIDPLAEGAKAMKLPNDVGYGYVVGMIPHEKAPGQWVIRATHYGQVNGTGPYKKNLLEINPKTGKGTVIMPLSKIYEGLAVDSAGQLYAVTDQSAQLWRINPTSGSEVLVGNVDDDVVEALEFAIGDDAKRINVPNLPQESWVGNGLLLAFSDASNEFLVIDPNSGDHITYKPKFLASDVEGIVFFTRKTDPFGVVVDPVGD